MRSRAASSTSDVSGGGLKRLLPRFILPGITALTLLYIVAGWAIISGAFTILAAIRPRKEIQGELFMAIGGIASVASGLLLIVVPGAGLLSLIWLLAAYAIVFGVMLIALAWRLRSHQEQPGGRWPVPTERRRWSAAGAAQAPLGQDQVSKANLVGVCD